MSVHIVIQPVPGYGAEVIEPSPGVRQLIAGSDQADVTVQVPARIGGLADTARFARSLAVAATEFAEWCESQNRNRSFTERPEAWAASPFAKAQMMRRSDHGCSAWHAIRDPL